MKRIRGCQQDEVWNHWKKVEKISEDNTTWRNDIRCPLPQNIKWFLAEIEEKDLAKIFIISSDDWKSITETFRLVETVNALNIKTDEKKVKNILEKKRIYQNNIDGLDRKFIFVSSSTEGNFTIIEGNKRAVALLCINKLVGNQIYLGISNGIRNYHWSRYSN